MTIEDGGLSGVAEKHTDLFDSPYLSEHYDLLLDNYFKTKVRDVPVYWDLFKQIESPNPVLLDIGTGTGRILTGLMSEAASEKVDVSDWTFIGLDISQHMLDRAKKVTSIPPGGPQVHWTRGSALELDRVPLLDGGKTKAALILFSAGAFSHLYEADQPEQFLTQIAKVIEPNRGRACVSIGNSFMPDKSGKDAALPQIDGPTQIVSKEFPDIIYENRILSNETQGSTLTENRVILVMKKAGGQVNVIERNHISTVLRLWTKVEFTQLASRLGFQVLSCLEGSEETYFTLRLPQ
ncbi:S-adenosyl-L-methionine-dependent methyltransferase [Aspergillus terreus]|uniref:S-adenosyl-L-methionine-dependent methyltransferase n=1 Tax=Aspergillus terreus TaxID=33178 RepID=A0A5M3YX15_ASPTE|nr:hypothetical protein ATETN484_0005004700 [Aspergillus terreus]GFF16714.1 S-adenosyl-L-methionine-dependent methyltransferase [Aspergillus terreus]